MNPAIQLCPLRSGLSSKAQRRAGSGLSGHRHYAQQGELLLKTQIGEELVTQFAADTAAKDVKTNIGIQFLPSVGPELDWDPGEVNIRFEMDKLNFDWRVNQTQFKFIPGDIEISVKQQPDVIIKYIGGPLYVPPSADPDHEPIDVQA